MTKQMRKGLWTLALAAAGCGGVTVEGGPDAAGLDEVDAAAASDAPGAPDADRGPCDLTAPFGNIAPVGGINSLDSDEFVALSPDELTVYLASNVAAPGTADFGIQVATRTSREAGFGAPAPLTVLNTDSDDRSPSVSADGLRLYFHSSRTGGYDVYVSSRANLAAGFGDPVALGAGVNTAATETSPTISGDGQTVYFDRDSGAGTHLWRATLGPTGFQTASAMTELGDEPSHSAVLSSDGLTLFFAGTRAGGAGLIDIWTATRATTSSPFVDIRNVSELNTERQEFPDWISPDGCRLYFTSQPDTPGAGFDVYVAERPH